MKADYKNWMPKELLILIGSITSFFFLGFILLQRNIFSFQKTLHIILSFFFAIITVLGLICFFLFVNMHRMFSYKGKRKLSKHIIEGIAEYATIPEGGKGQDVGCGSGALTIACAKRNPKASMIGLDYWGKQYPSFSQKLCEKNASCEGVGNVTFLEGNAIKMEYPDESFDFVTSNYVYHNISGIDKKELLRETLRLLKKGGTFALHDIMPRRIYGDMNAFIKELKEMGYEKVELINTANGALIHPKEAKFLFLSTSALLFGKK